MMCLKQYLIPVLCSSPCIDSYCVKICCQITDKDLEKRRCEQRVDPLTDILYTKSEYAPEVPATDEKDKDDEEEEEEEEEEAEEEMIEEEEEVSHDQANDDFQLALQTGCL